MTELFTRYWAPLTRVLIGVLKANFFGKDSITLDFKLGRLITNTVTIQFECFLQE